MPMHVIYLDELTFIHHCVKMTKKTEVVEKYL